MLASPAYLSYLASSKILQNTAFIAYLDYLQYWTKAPYIQYLAFPIATLRVLELLQIEEFRKDILSPNVGARLAEELIEGSRGGS